MRRAIRSAPLPSREPPVSESSSIDWSAASACPPEGLANTQLDESSLPREAEVEVGRGLRSAAELVEMGFAPARVAAAMDASVGDVLDETAVRPAAESEGGSPPGAAADVQIDSVAFPAMVSRKHCRLRRDADGAFFVDDLGAANGTTLNGRRACYCVLLAE
ncbi:hypothetical protein EMIHUDRAFT_219817 [Emiliania huxleyi CCMP1516]|uniref:FHA domain-containing protein n=2 Tax=Emiliania huxleyi TaxID=2903 RepID=A0A0D3I3C4_EMIH1|nr:hypothetical protein EMIHUDRAFT_219817 [Emiliania huxleyi CCMP1516]EOD05759.1 hypothetical protein EMIHUDRAFT_219817 [Emiliania huxleyi CCMP1516]|eukprot:XP_005758188.1 hypothetical protein EMIHUDRAFT_219817 [Emiliania huxleyi CCMP1516]